MSLSSGATLTLSADFRVWSIVMPCQGVSREGSGPNSIGKITVVSPLPPSVRPASGAVAVQIMEAKHGACGGSLSISDRRSWRLDWPSWLEVGTQNVDEGPAPTGSESVLADRPPGL